MSQKSCVSKWSWRLVPLGAIAAALSVLALGQVGKPAVPQSPCVSPTGQTVSLLVKNPDGTTLAVPNVPWIQNMNVRLGMLNAQSLNPQLAFETSYYCPWGEYVTSINGWVESGSNYWQLVVNGVPSQFGINTAILQPSDSIVWQVASVQLPATATGKKNVRFAETARPASYGQAHMCKLRNGRRLLKRG